MDKPFQTLNLLSNEVSSGSVIFYEFKQKTSQVA